MKKKLDNKTIEQILYCKMILDKSDEETAEACDVGRATVSTIVRIFKAVKADNWETIVRVAESMVSSLDAVRAIAEGQGKEVPSYVVEAFLNRNKKLETPVVLEPVKEPVTDNSGLYMVKVLEALHAQNELLAQLCDVVIPHWVADLKDNANANADSLGQRLDQIVALLDGIKCNTRKRGV